MNYKKIYLAAIMLSLSACSTWIDFKSKDIADIATKDLSLGDPILISKCRYMEKIWGNEDPTGYSDQGVCIAYKTAFVYRSIDRSDIQRGSNRIIKLKDIEIVKTSKGGFKDFQILTKNTFSQFAFFPDEKLTFSDIASFNYEKNAAISERFLSHYERSGIASQRDAKKMETSTTESNVIIIYQPN